MGDPSDRIKALRERIRSSEEIVEDDQEVLLGFSDELALRSSDYSDHRHEKLLRHCTIAAEEVGGLAAALHDRDATEELVRWINRTYDNEETNSDYRTALRVFGHRLAEADPGRFAEGELDSDGYPKSIAWIPSGTSKTYDPAPDPSKMLRWKEHVVPMIEAALNDRDAAMIALAFDVGPRGGEFHDMQVDDITDGQHGKQITVRGKRGQRTVTMVPSVPYVTQWLGKHPAGGVGDIPLWTKLGEATSISSKMVSEALRAAAQRAGVNKPVTLTNFRKSSAAHLASKGMNQAHLEDHHGWVRGSKTASRYVSVFGEEAELETRRIWGEDVPEKDDEKVAPLDCPRCGKETPREKPLCMWCGQGLEPQAAQQAEQIDDLLVSLIANKSGKQAEELVELRREAKNDPTAATEIVDRLRPMLDSD